jgi:hypothetical protein
VSDIHQWLQLALEFVVLFGAVIIIRRDNAKKDEKLSTIEQLVTDIRIGMKDCVTWDELNRQLGPLRNRGESHEKRLEAIEVRCKLQHKGE